MLRYVTLPDRDGRQVDLADFRRRQALVVVFHHGEPCAACSGYVRRLAADEATIRATGAALIAIGQSAPVALPFPALMDSHGAAANAQRVHIPALLITDQYGEIYVEYAGGEAHALPDADEIAAWLLRIDTLCDECTTPEWDAGKL
jgi:peroxiredoxin